MPVPAQDWFTVLEHYHRLNATISDLIMGNAYTFRVYSENKVGMSEECLETADIATIQKIGNPVVVICETMQNVLDGYIVVGRVIVKELGFSDGETMKTPSRANRKQCLKRFAAHMYRPFRRHQTNTALLHS